jgi:hypothetical protein
MSETIPPVDRDDVATAELREAFETARRGDPAVLPRLRELLDERPELWRTFGDVAAHARAAWIALIAGDDLALRESTARAADALRAGVAGPSPTPLEALLAERIVASHLQRAYAEFKAAECRDASVKQLAFAERRLMGAHRRHLQAVGALATLRRLLPPSAALPASRDADPVVARESEGAAADAGREAAAGPRGLGGEIALRRACGDAEDAAILSFRAERGRRGRGPGRPRSFTGSSGGD